jgi:hypothetical protein
VDDVVRLLVSEDGADPERIEEIAGYLRRELDQLDVVDVRREPAGQSPEGTRAFELMAVGGLLVSVGNSAQALRKVVSVVREWLARSPGPVRTVRLELGGDVLELSQASESEQDRLIDLFVRRHSEAGGMPWPDAAKP